MSNKEFRVRHGLAVNNNIFVANTVTGNVGIGTSNPLYKLDIVGTINAANILINGGSIAANLAPAFNQANAAYDVANGAFGTANNGYAAANTKLANTDGVYTAGSLNISGNLTVNNFVEFSQNITYNYTITVGRNALSAGPISIANGNVVTIPSGSVWTVT